jgi:hypothetical protein
MAFFLVSTREGVDMCMLKPTAAGSCHVATFIKRDLSLQRGYPRDQHQGLLKGNE